jgi:hypothetical protein
VVARHPRRLRDRVGALLGLIFFSCVCFFGIPTESWDSFLEVLLLFKDLCLLNTVMFYQKKTGSLAIHK